MRATQNSSVTGSSGSASKFYDDEYFDSDTDDEATSEGKLFHIRYYLQHLNKQDATWEHLVWNPC